MRSQNDFGASHEFRNAPKKEPREIRVSRTVYLKEKHLRYASDVICKENDMNISEAIDLLLQSGIAWQEQLKYNNQEKLSKYEPKTT